MAVGQPAPGFNWICVPRKDGDAIPGFLSVPDGTITGGTERERWKRVIVCFQFLEADDIGGFALQPLNEVAQARPNAIDVEGGNFHRIIIMLEPTAGYHRLPQPTAAYRRA